MTDISQTPPAAPIANETERGAVILAYVLFIIGWPTCHLSTIVAVIFAYIKRNEVRGTIWESHFDNIINTFWLTLVLGIVFGLMCMILVGIPLIIGLAIWFLYRTIKGLVRAIDSKAFY